MIIRGNDSELERALEFLQPVDSNEVEGRKAQRILKTTLSGQERCFEYLAQEQKTRIVGKGGYYHRVVDLPHLRQESFDRWPR